MQINNYTGAVDKSSHRPEPFMMQSGTVFIQSGWINRGSSQNAEFSARTPFLLQQGDQAGGDV